MPNLASLLKDEIARVARKVIRGEVAALKTASSAHRAELVALRRRVQALERELQRSARSASRSAPAPADTPDGAPRVRFSPKGLLAQRKRLGLSAHECGLLVGASGQSIYNWEAGSARPRDKHLPAIAALKTLGKKSAAARLAALETTD